MKTASASLPGFGAPPHAEPRDPPADTEGQPGPQLISVPQHQGEGGGRVAMISQRGPQQDSEL